MPVSTEKKLLFATARGDEKAFQQLFDLYKHRVYAYAMHFTHSVPVSEGIVQDIFLKLWLQRKSLAEIDRFEAWLYTITRNLCFDHLKKMAHEQALRKEWSKQVKLSDNSTENEILRSNYETLVHQALEQLPPQQKKIYSLSFFQGQKLEEIAQYLNISRNTVKAHLAKARASIRNYLAVHIDLIVFLLVMLFFI